jgi:hypothetical protein
MANEYDLIVVGQAVLLLREYQASNPVEGVLQLDLYPLKRSKAPRKWTVKIFGKKTSIVSN